MFVIYLSVLRENFRLWYDRGQAKNAREKKRGEEAVHRENKFLQTFGSTAGGSFSSWPGLNTSEQTNSTAVTTTTFSYGCVQSIVHIRTSNDVILYVI